MLKLQVLPSPLLSVFQLTGSSPRFSELVSGLPLALPLPAGEVTVGFPEEDEEEGEGEEVEEEEGERGLEEEEEEEGGCWGLEVRATDIGRGELRMASWTCSGVGGCWERQRETII